jgi:hypothetical protein
VSRILCRHGAVSGDFPEKVTICGRTHPAGKSESARKSNFSRYSKTNVNNAADGENVVSI